MIKLQVQDCLSPITKEQALAYGKRHGIYMPDALAAHLAKYNGGGFHSEAAVNEGARNTASVSNFVGIDEHYSYYSIQFKWDWVLDRHSGLVPIATDGTGHPFVLWRKQPDRVFYYDRDKSMPTTEISLSIAHFLDSITLPTEVEKEMRAWPKHQSSTRLCDEKVMASLIKEHGGVNAQIEGDTLLYTAGLFGNPFSIRWLLKSGADPNLVSASGSYPLHGAADSRSIDCCRVLVECGAKINAVDKEGRTPLISAIYGGNVRNAEFLLEKGADFKARDNEGRNATDYMAQAGTMAREFLKMCERVGAM